MTEITILLDADLEVQETGGLVLDQGTGVQAAAGIVLAQIGPNLMDNLATAGIATIAALRAARTGAGYVVHVSGRLAAGDGAGGRFYWDASSTATDDGALVVRPTAVSSGSPGRWLRDVTSDYNAAWWCAGLSTASALTTALTAADAAAVAAGKALSIRQLFILNTMTFSAPLVFKDSGKLVPQSSQTVTIAHSCPRAPVRQIFDISAAGSKVYITNADRPVQDAWYGASVGSANSAPAMAAAVNATGLTISNISSIVDDGSAAFEDGSGYCKVTTATAHGFTTGDDVAVWAVLGVLNANAIAQVTVLNSTSFIMVNVPFQNQAYNQLDPQNPSTTYTSGTGRCCLYRKHEVVISGNRLLTTEIRALTPVTITGVGKPRIRSFSNANGNAFYLTSGWTDIEKLSVRGYEYVSFTDPNYNPSGLENPGSILVTHSGIRVGDTRNSQGPIPQFKLDNVEIRGFLAALSTNNLYGANVTRLDIANPYSWGWAFGTSRGIQASHFTIKRAGILEALKAGYSGSVTSPVNNQFMHFLIEDCGRLNPNPASWQEAIDLFVMAGQYNRFGPGIIRRCGNGGFELKAAPPLGIAPGKVTHFDFSGLHIEFDLDHGAGLNLHWTGDSPGTGYPAGTSPGGPDILAKITTTGCHFTGPGNASSCGAITIEGFSEVAVEGGLFEGLGRTIAIIGAGGFDATVRRVTLGGGLKIRRARYGVHAYGGVIEKLIMDGMDVEAICPLSLGSPGGPSAASVTAIGAGANGKIRLTATAHGIRNGAWCYVSAMTGAEEAQGYWTATVIDANTLDLDNSVWLRNASGLSGKIIASGGMVIDAELRNSRLVSTDKTIAAVTAGLITNIVDANGVARVTSAAHGLSGGQKVQISGVRGTVEANGECIIAAVDANTFDLVNVPFSNAYTGGGAWRRMVSDNGLGITPYGMMARYLHRLQIHNSHIEGQDHALSVAAQTVAGQPVSTGGVIRRSTLISRSKEAARFDEGLWDIEDTDLQSADHTYAGVTTSNGAIVRIHNGKRGKVAALPVAAGARGETFAAWPPTPTNPMGWVCTTAGSRGSAVWSIMGAGSSGGSGGSGGVYTPQTETMALESAMAVKPSVGRFFAMDALILALKTAGVWAKRDLIYIPAAHAASVAVLNWKSPTLFPLRYGRLITNAVNNGSGLVRLTVAGHGLATGDSVLVAAVAGATGANGTRTITVIDANTIDLNATTFGGTYTAGSGYISALTGALAHTTDRGFLPNGTSQFLDTNFFPYINGLTFSTTSASMGVWSLTNISSASQIDLGVAASKVMSITSRTGGGVLAGPLNTLGSSGADCGAVTNSLGLSLITRSGDTVRGYRNGTYNGGYTQAPAGLAEASLMVNGNRAGSTVSSLSTRQLAAVVVGGNLTEEEQLAEYNALRTYLQAVGAA